MFSIRFFSEDEVSRKGLVSHWGDPEKVAFGEIVLGGFQEVFLAPLSYWSRDQYLTQWHHSLNNLLATGKNSCLITAIDRPESGQAICLWQIYVFSDRIVFQNHLKFSENVRYPVYELEPNLTELGYQQVDEDGEKISEWEIRKEDLVHFIEKTDLPTHEGTGSSPIR